MARDHAPPAARKLVGAWLERDVLATGSALADSWPMIKIGLVGLAVAAHAGCGAAPPVWYAGGGTNWTVPLVDAKRNAELVVAATIHGAGPFYFLLDPDAPRSVIDDRVAGRLDLYTDNRWVRVANQRDVTVPRKWYEVLDLEAGDLRVRNLKMLSAPAGSLDRDDLPIAGILGADLLSRTIVIEVDRDAGVARLALTGHARIPEAAVAIRGKLHYGALYVQVPINGGRPVTLQVRLGLRSSTLTTAAMGELGLPTVEARAVLVDETGTRETVHIGAIAESIGLGALAVRDAVFLSHVDKRARDDFPHDGFLGQNVLALYRVVVDRDHEVIWLAPRSRPLD